MKVRWLVAFLLAAFTGVAAAQQGQVPTTETALGSVRIPRSVKADGKDLKAGTYQVRLTAQDRVARCPGTRRWSAGSSSCRAARSSGAKSSASCRRPK